MSATTLNDNTVNVLKLHTSFSYKEFPKDSLANITVFYTCIVVWRCLLLNHLVKILNWKKKLLLGFYQNHWAAVGMQSIIDETKGNNRQRTRPHRRRPKAHTEGDLHPTYITLINYILYPFTARCLYVAFCVRGLAIMRNHRCGQVILYSNPPTPVPVARTLII